MAWMSDKGGVVKMGAAGRIEQVTDRDDREPRPPLQASEHGRQWTFLSNHGHVLVCLARDPEARLRDVALAVGITERAVQKIVSDLEEAGVVERVRDGRRNRYRLFIDRPLRHPIEAHRSIGVILGGILGPVAMRRLAGTTAD